MRFKAFGPQPQSHGEKLIEDVEWLLKFNTGEHEILRQLGYLGRPISLKSALGRQKRHDLIPQIFEHDASRSTTRKAAA